MSFLISLCEKAVTMDIDEERVLILEQYIASLQERVTALEAARNTSPPIPSATSIPSARL